MRGTCETGNEVLRDIFLSLFDIDGNSSSRHHIFYILHFLSSYYT